MAKTYEKPNLIIKNYQLKTHILLSGTNYGVYDTGTKKSVQYTLGSINDDLNS